MITPRSFSLLLLFFIFVEIKHISSRETNNSRKKEIVNVLINRKSAGSLHRESKVHEKNSGFLDGKSGVFHLGFLKSNAWKFRPMQKDVHGMKKSEVLQPNFDQKDETSTLNTRGPTSNIITDLKVPKMGPALQWIPDNSNNSKGAADNATQAQQDVNANNNEGQVDAKVKNLLDALDDVSNAAVNSTMLNNVTMAIKNGGSVLRDINAQKKQIIGPGYYEPECDDKKKCPDDHYCHHFVCVECHRNKHACTFREQCCNNMECVYGRCEQKPKGSPGAFCHKDKDCAGDACCVLEPTVDEDESICKPKLSEYHQCSPILFRKVWIGDNKPECGPCKDGLKCMQKGNDGNHEVCMKET